MRLLALLTAVQVIAAGNPAWAWRDVMPGDEYWPPITGNVGMKAFLGTWTPQTRDGLYMEHGKMTLHADGRITYALKKKPDLPTQYRVIEETPHYVVVMMRDEPWGTYPETFSFVLIQPLRASADQTLIGFNECGLGLNGEDRAPFSWSDDDEVLRRVWRESKSCNPAFKEPYDGSPFFGNRGWAQVSEYFRPGPRW